MWGFSDEQKGNDMTDEAKKSPLQVAANVTYPKLIAPTFGADSRGKFVAVRPVESAKTYLGIYMGDMPRVNLNVAAVEADHSLTMRIERGDFMGNPAIYVPALHQIVYGMESWWGELKSPDDIRQISDADIENVWYVQALKSLAASPTPASPVSQSAPCA